MAYTAPIISSTPLEGVDLTYTQQPYSQSAGTGSVDYPGLPFVYGTTTQTTNGGRYMWVLAATTINQYDAVGITSAFAASALTTTIAETATTIGFAQTAITSGYAGWVALQGTGSVNVLASAAADVLLYPTATAGYLDDAAGTTATFSLRGVVLVAARGTTNGSTTMMATYPVYQE